jgi:hypothetical protein
MRADQMEGQQPEAKQKTANLILPNNEHAKVVQEKNNKKIGRGNI